MANQCDHIELTTTHPDRASDFYSKLFGWKIKATPIPDAPDAGTAAPDAADPAAADAATGGEYLMFQTGDDRGGGIAGKMVPEQPTAWMPYITVDSVQKILDAATTLGADTVMGRTPIGDMGAIAVLRDPTGATIGLWETTAKPAAASKKAKAKGSAKKAKAPAKKSAKAPAKKPAKKKKGKKG